MTSGGGRIFVEGMWNERYAQPGFAYGTQPNAFLRAQADLLMGPVLSLGEGEGRNAVFLAQRGLEVLGVDLSPVGLEKARGLAAERGVRIETLVADLAEYVPPAEAFGAVVSIFAHTPSAVRRQLHARVRAALRPGGVFLLEGYTPAQIGRGTGGPPAADMCVTLDELRAEFDGFSMVVGRECERQIQEGKSHTGPGAVVQFVARKPVD